MSKKNNPKAEKAKRNLEYAKLHKKKKKMPMRGGPRSYGPRPPAPGAPGEGPAPAPGEEGGSDKDSEA